MQFSRAQQLETTSKIGIAPTEKAAVADKVVKTVYALARHERIQWINICQRKDTREPNGTE